jgi:3-oxosteroid 1-dehydrogenase
VDAELLDVYLDTGQAVLDFLEDEGVPFDWIPRYPDYYAELPGGRLEGRYLSSPVFDPAVLPEPWRARAAESPYYTAAPASWQEIQQWGGYGTAASWDGWLLSDRRAHGIRGYGGATTGFLLAACIRRDVEFAFETTMTSLLTGPDGSVTGVRASTAEGDTVEIRGRAVILASGGYDHDPDLKRRLDDHAPAVPLTAPGVTGTPLRSALALGAEFVNMGGQLLAPIYRPGPGELNIAAREAALPGAIVVNRAGRRFCNDSFYWALGIGLAAFDATTCSYANTPAFLVVDQLWKDSYRLGPAGPGEVPDWMARGETLDELAAALGVVDPAALRATVDAYNRDAARGEDPEWGRGSTAYSRNSGDPAIEPNPCVRPLTGPFYGVQLEPGTMGTLSGLAVDRHARVRRVGGEPIRGLYACGNAMANLVEGRWYTSGTSNGRGLFFGARAAAHAMSA